MEQIIPIADWEHFVHLSLEFDRKNQTQTMLCYMTIPEVAEKYTHWSRKSINAEWERNISSTFGEKNIRTSDEMAVHEFTHFNNIVTFNNSFKQFGFDVLHPIHVHYSKEYSCAHPGNKRIRILYDHYKEKVPVVITDYDQHHKNLGFAKYNFSGKSLYYSFSDEHFLKKHLNYSMLKEVNAMQQGYFNDTSFGKTNHLRELRTFEYKNDKIYCNGKSILEKENGTWMTVLSK